MDYFKNRKYEIIRMIFLIISGAIGHSKNDLFSYRISLQSYIKSYASSSWQDILKLLGNSDLNFPTSGPWLPRCKYESIQLDLTWYMILHCCSLVYAGCCGLNMQLYVQIPCCQIIYAGCSSLCLIIFTPLQPPFWKYISYTIAHTHICTFWIPYFKSKIWRRICHLPLPFS